MSSVISAQKLRGLRDVLVTNWIRLPPAQVSTFIDLDKLVALPGRAALPRMLNNCEISKSDKLYIKKLRDKVNRKKATNKLRKKNQEEFVNLEEQVSDLKKERKKWLDLKQRLAEEIANYSKG